MYLPSVTKNKLVKQNLLLVCIYNKRQQSKTQNKSRWHWQPNRHLHIQSQTWKYQNNVLNLFRVHWRLLVSLLLTLTSFHILFWCFHCCLWPSKFQLGTVSIHCLNLNWTYIIRPCWNSERPAKFAHQS